MTSPAGGHVFRNVQAIRWDGSNGDAVAQLCDRIAVDESTWSVASEDAGALLLLQHQDSTGAEAIWPVYDHHPWVVVAQDHGILGRLTEDEYAASWTEADGVAGVLESPLFAEPERLRRIVTRLRARMYGGMATRPIPALAAGEERVLAVEVQPHQPDDGYHAHAVVISGSAAALAALEIVQALAGTAARVDVTVRNTTAAAAPAALLLVHVT